MFINYSCAEFANMTLLPTQILKEIKVIFFVDIKSLASSTDKLT